jgi:hypothetical protein
VAAVFSHAKPVRCRHCGRLKIFQERCRSRLSPTTKGAWREKAARLRPGSQSAKRDLGSAFCERGDPHPHAQSGLRRVFWNSLEFACLRAAPRAAFSHHAVRPRPASAKGFGASAVRSKNGRSDSQEWADNAVELTHSEMHSASERVARLRETLRRGRLPFGHVRTADASYVTGAFGVEDGRGRTATGPAAVSVNSTALEVYSIHTRLA